MEFIKKNWWKLLAAFVFFIGVVLSFIKLITVIPMPGLQRSAGILVPLTDAQKAGVNSQIWLQIALITAFVTLTAALVLSLVEKSKLSTLVLLCGSVVSLLLFVTAFIVGGPMLESLKSTAEGVKKSLDALPAGTPKSMIDATKFSYKSALNNYQTQLFGNIINILVFAVLPLLYGSKRLCGKED